MNKVPKMAKFRQKLKGLKNPKSGQISLKSKGINLNFLKILDDF